MSGQLEIVTRALLEPEKTSEKLNESRAFVELANYIERSVYSGTLLSSFLIFICFM